MAARNEDSARDRARRRARERRRQAIRRRRLVAVVGGLLVVLLVLLATSAFGGDSGKSQKAEDQLKPLTAPPDSAASAHGRGIRAIDGVLSYTPYVSRGTPNQMLVALTFDDGPGPLTPQFIKTLRDNHAPATFFVITAELKDFGDASREAARNGFEVGDHTVNHQMLATLGRADQEHEIVDGVQQMKDAGLPPPQLFRPPGNSFNDTTLGILRDQHMLMTLWGSCRPCCARPSRARSSSCTTAAATAPRPSPRFRRSSTGSGRGGSSSSRCRSWCSRTRRPATRRAPTRRPVSERPVRKI
jgi:hypothetical protein